jgi:hypothetical protein
VQPRRAFASLAPNLTTINMLSTDYNSYYNALPLVFQRRYRDGFNFSSNYTLAVVANYELPYSVVTWQTGVPFNITNAAVRNNTGGNNDRPNLAGDPKADSPTIGRWFNTGAFEAQPVNTVGASVVPRNLLHGPSQRRLDLSLFKDVRISAAARVQVRVEAYNVLNTVNFANPNSMLGNPAFGTINQTTNSTMGAPRQMQFAAKLLF